jgi:hypothetical protein
MPVDPVEMQAASTKPAGTLMESFNRNLISSMAIPLTSGTLRLTAMEFPIGRPIASVTFISGSTAASVPLNQWAALYDASRNLLVQSVNQTTGAWAANAGKTFAFSTPYVARWSGFYYVGLMVQGTAAPSLTGLTAASVAANTIAPILHGNSTTTLTTTAPAAALAITPLAGYPYIYLA